MIFYNQFAVSKKIQHRTEVTRITIYKEGTVLILETHSHIYK